MTTKEIKCHCGRTHYAMKDPNAIPAMRLTPTPILPTSVVFESFKCPCGRIWTLNPPWKRALANARAMEVE